MICLDSTDVIEGGASVDAVVDYQFHGLVGTTFTQLAAGVMGTTLTTVLYTAGSAVSVVSAVNVTLCLDPANGGNPRYLIPETISLGAGYSLHSDGAKLTVMDGSGGLVSGLNISDTAYGAGWNGVTTVAPSKNAVYDEMELQPKAVLTTKGDLVYASAANVLARLPKGGAGLKLFLNAGNTAPEWASGVKIGNFTRDISLATGAVAYSGVGFKPSAIFLFETIAAVNQAGFGFGTTSDVFCAEVLNSIWNPQTGFILLIRASAGVDNLVALTSLDSDGFTLTYTKRGSPTGTATIGYLALR